MESLKIKNAVDKRYALITQNCFGNWLESLWITYETLDSIDDQKNAFFYLIKKLLSDNKIKFLIPGDIRGYTKNGTPNSDYTINDPEVHWRVSNDEVIRYLQSNWPAAIRNEKDPILIRYFFEMPGLIWRGHDGSYHGS